MEWSTVLITIGSTVLGVGILLCICLLAWGYKRRQLRGQLKKDELLCPQCHENLYLLRAEKVRRNGFAELEEVFEDTLVCLNGNTSCGAIGVLLVVAYRDPAIDRAVSNHHHPKGIISIPPERVRRLVSVK